MSKIVENWERTSQFATSKSVKYVQFHVVNNIISLLE
jgi:hypothetical protein